MNHKKRPVELTEWELDAIMERIPRQHQHPPPRLKYQDQRGCVRAMMEGCRSSINRVAPHQVDVFTFCGLSRRTLRNNHLFWLGLDTHEDLLVWWAEQEKMLDELRLDGAS
jgi:hypothetical protein